MYSPEQAHAIELFNQGNNIFLSGGAGVGKSYVINECIKQYNKTHPLNLDNKDLVVTASTGIAAILINGTTLHSFAGIGLGNLDVGESIKKMHYIVKERWRRLRVLIIDEVSMLNPDYFDKLNNIVRLIRNNIRPFGGIQLLISGDFLQLPPVKSYFAFQSTAWKEINLQRIILTQNMRQTDNTFHQALDKIRRGIADDFVQRVIGPCVREVETVNGIKPTRMFPTKDSVMRINIEELRKLDDIIIIPAKWTINDPSMISKETPPDWMMKKVWSQVPIMEKLPIAPYAQIMLTKNLDITNGLANGSRGIVLKMTNEVITVQFVNGQIIDILKETFDVKLSPTKVVYIHQFPLLLAWATTIHKSQGMTLDLAEMDLSASFEYGMIYVALSRVRSLDGLYINAINYQKIKAHPDALEFYGFTDGVVTMDR